MSSEIDYAVIDCGAAVFWALRLRPDERTGYCRYSSPVLILAARLRGKMPEAQAAQTEPEGPVCAMLLKPTSP
jgi:hypothetical protein